MNFLLNQFKIRTTEDKIDFFYIEKKYGITIPPIYQIFLNTYVLERASKHIYYYPNQEVGLDAISWHLEATVQQSTGDDMDEDFLNLKMLLVGYSDMHADGIVVGTQGEYIDKIYVSTDYPERFIPIADNIFEFYRGIVTYDTYHELLKFGIEI